MSQAVTITARHAYGNIATGYTGTVAFRSSDTQAALPTNYTFTAADAGTHTFTVTLTSPGTQTSNVADLTNTGLKGSTSVKVTTASTSGGGGGGGA